MLDNSYIERLINSINKRSTVILVGFMGSGKTTTGKALAKQLSFHFLDTDTAIEELVGLNIDSIFQKKGERYFRELERNFIRQLDVKNTIISTGGGLPCWYDNMDILNKKGVTVYLKKTPEELYNRLKQDKESRPLLKQHSQEDLYHFIKQLLKEREKYYLQAQVIF